MRTKLLYASILFIGLAILACVMFCFYGCVGWTEWNRSVWNVVQQEDPECRDQERPHTILAEGGIYLPWSNVVIICGSVGSLDTLKHEYRHACGNLIGETPRRLWEYQEVQW